jgi:hypothetical protein
MTVNVPLTEGPHSIGFHNPDAMADARTVLVPRDHPPRELAVTLERRPPRVEVRAPREATARIVVHIDDPADDAQRNVREIRTLRVRTGQAVTIDVVEATPVSAARPRTPAASPRALPR